MATCNASSLLSDARANGFDSLPYQFQGAVELQLIKNASGTTSDISTLISDACSNGFSCLDSNLFKAVELQLLCNATLGVPPCPTPDTPQNFHVDETTDGTVCFDGDVNDPAPALDYLVHYGYTNGGPYPLLKSFNTINLNQCVGGLSNGTIYYFVLQARNSETCVSGFTGQVSATPNP